MTASGDRSERGRALRIVEGAIHDWTYRDAVATDVLAVLINIGNQIADDGGQWAERVNGEIDRTLEDAT